MQRPALRISEALAQEKDALAKAKAEKEEDEADLP